MKRDYAPAVYIHDAACADAPRVALVYPLRAAAQAYPTGRPHNCFSRETVHRGRKVVVEHVNYETHRYVNIHGIRGGRWFVHGM